MALQPASEVLIQYLQLLDRIFGMYIDACAGFETVGKKMTDRATVSQHASRLFMGDSSPNRSDAKYNHVTTVGQFIARNQRNGENHLLLSQACIVFAYSIWDTTIRPSYCAALRKKQDEVTSDIMGDLRHYRNAIAHNNAMLQKSTRRLTFVEVGNVVALNQSQMRELFTILFDDLSDLNLSHTGDTLDLPFYRQLNQSK